MYRSGILGLTILAPRGAPCALEGERCSGYIGTPWPRRGPRRTKWLVSLAQPRGGCRCSLGRLAHRCVSGPPRNLQRCLLFFLSLAPSLALFGLLYLILSSVRQPLPKRSGGAATTGQAPSCRRGHVGFSRVPCSPAEYTNSRSSEAAATIFRNARMQSPLPYRHAAAHARRFRYHRCAR